LVKLKETQRKKQDEGKRKALPPLRGAAAVARATKKNTIYKTQKGCAQ